MDRTLEGIWSLMALALISVKHVQGVNGAGTRRRNVAAVTICSVPYPQADEDIFTPV